MRIGEIAALVEVTSRAVRHHHHIGLLPEPARQANGYRAYTVRDAALPARIRRLTEIGSRRPVEFVRPLGRRGSARTLRFHADDARAAVAALGPRPVTPERTAPSSMPGPLA